jgi:hypothetical protein
MAKPTRLCRNFACLFTLQSLCHGTWKWVWPAPRAKILGIGFIGFNLLTPLPAAQLVVEWNDNTTAETGYEIQRRTTDGAFVTLGTVTANVTRFVDTTVVAGIAYAYRVRAYNSFQSSDFSNITGFTLPEEDRFASRRSEQSSKLMNLSARAVPGSDQDALIVGFVIEDAPKAVLLRAIGPGIPGINGAEVSSDPALTVYAHGSAVLRNDNWNGTNELKAAFHRVGAFALPIGSLDAVLLTSFPRGGSTFVVESPNRGFAVAEVYDADSEDSAGRLVNLSVRARTEAGDGVLIVGFVIGGSTPMRVLLRAGGPALAESGVAGFVPDPQLTLFWGTEEWGHNDNWGGGDELTTAFATVGASSWTDSTSSDAALLVTLPPGAYTAVVSGVNGATGIALAEVYEVP